MAQATDYSLADQSGAAFRAELNSILAAIASQNSGTSAPATTYANMPWVDTTNGRAKKRNNANTTWVDLGPMDSFFDDAMPVSSKSAGYTALSGDRGKLIDFTSGATLAFTAAATLGDGWFCAVRNGHASATVTLDPNAAELIDGQATIALDPGEACLVVCDGSGFKTIGRPPTMAGDSGSGGRRGAVPAPGAGDAAAGKFLKADGTWAALAAMPRGHLAGLTLSNNGTDATNDIDIAAGAARDNGNTADLVLAAAITKRLDAAWAVGTNQGGLDTGSIANGTYHLWLIKRPDTGVVDVLFSASASSPTMPANYTLKRRIGSILRESAAIVAFAQTGDEFLRKTAILDVAAANPGTSAVTRTLSVPTGIKVWALVRAGISFGSNTSSDRPALLISSLDENDQAPSATAAPLAELTLFDADTSQPYFAGAVRTNTSAQIRSRQSASSANTTQRIATRGWIDRRGRDD